MDRNNEDASLDGIDDAHYMRRALKLAECASDMGEVPVGAVLVADGEIIAEGWNQPIAQADATAHAEIDVLRRAGSMRQNYRLTGATLYVTVEPCAMCAGALVNSRVSTVVYATDDPKAGYCGSLGNLVKDPRLNHHVEVRQGIMAASSQQLLRRFFAARREGI